MPELTDLVSEMFNLNLNSDQENIAILKSKLPAYKTKHMLHGFFHQYLYNLVEEHQRKPTRYNQPIVLTIDVLSAPLTLSYSPKQLKVMYNGVLLKNYKDAAVKDNYEHLSDVIRQVAHSSELPF